MSSNSAKIIPRTVVFVVYDGVTLLDVTGPAQVFATANAENTNNECLYRVCIVSLNGGLITTDTGIEISTLGFGDISGKIDTLVVAGGRGVFEAVQGNEMVHWLRQQMPLSRRTVSTCMGAFLTAETGLLLQSNITTHWRWCDELQRRYPQLNVVAEPIFIKEGNYASSAGVTSGIDLALSLVEDDHGRELSLAIAKSLVLYLKRVGDQSQFSSLLISQFTERGNRFSPLNAWINENLDRDLKVSELASKAGMSERSFSRQYTAQVGLSPGKAVEAFRFEKAKRLLETTDTSLKVISVSCGFRDYERMRRTFFRHIGVAPIEYRRRFGKQA